MEEDQEDSSNKKVREICDAYDRSDAAKEAGQKVKNCQTMVGICELEGGDHQAMIKLKKSPYKASWCTQFNAVLWRSWISVVRDDQVVRMKFIQTIVSFYLELPSCLMNACFIMCILFLLQFTSLLIAFIYQGNHDNVMNINGVLFLLLTNTTFQHVYAVVNVSRILCSFYY